MSEFMGEPYRSLGECWVVPFYISEFVGAQMNIESGTTLRSTDF